MYFPFKNTFVQWWETHSIRGDLGLVRLEMRMARRLGRTYDNVAKAKAHINGVLNREGVVTDVEMQKEYEAYYKQLLKEFKELKQMAISFKTLLNRDLDKLERLEQDIATHPQGQEDIIKHVHEMMRAVETTIERFFRELTSFENVNLSAQRLLGRASQIRELYYDLRKSRGPERAFIKEYKKVDSAEREGKAPSQKHVEAMLASLNKSLEEQSAGIGVSILLLQELVREIDDQKKEIVQLTQRPTEEGKYPRAWAQNHIKLLDSIKEDIHEWIVHEVSAGRLFLSRVEHAQHSMAA